MSGVDIASIPFSSFYKELKEFMSTREHIMKSTHRSLIIINYFK